MGLKHYKKSTKFVIKKVTYTEIVDEYTDDTDLGVNEGIMEVLHLPRKEEEKPAPKRYWLRDKRLPEEKTKFNLTAKQIRLFIDTHSVQEMDNYLMGEMTSPEIIDAEVLGPSLSRLDKLDSSPSFNPEDGTRVAPIDSKICLPEADTCRLYWDCSSLVDLDKLFQDRSTKGVYSFERTFYEEDGERKERITSEWRKDRCDMHYSSWGTMLITKENKFFGRKETRYARPVLCFEFSVAKYYNGSNGLNSGIEPTAYAFMTPCLAALQQMKILDYCFYDCGFRLVMKHFMDHTELRRLDLSLNFKVPGAYTPKEYIQVLSMCSLNLQDSKSYGDGGSISFGCENSPYRVIFYDKTAEQKKYFLNNKMSNTREGTEDRKNFYRKHELELKNVLRYEVQFSSKFFKDRGYMTEKVENIDNCIRLATLQWRWILNHFNEQLGRANFVPDEDGSSLDFVLGKFEDLKNQGVYSNVTYATYSTFLVDCYKHGLKEVRASMSRQSFSYKYNWIKKNLNFDIKVKMREVLPIMRVINTKILVSYQQRLINTFHLEPAPIVQAV